MDFTKISKSAGGALSGIKSKLGMGDKNDQGYDDDYDDYDDGYGDGYRGGFDDRYDDDQGFDDYDDGYAGGRHQRSGDYEDDYRDDQRSSYLSTPRAEISSPRLISAREVRKTSRYDMEQRQPVAPNQVSVEPLPSLGEVAQPTMNFTSPYDTSANEPEMRDWHAVDDFHSEGLNSLFSPTDGGSRARRKLSVYRPASYNETEYIARSLKAGDAVVMCFATTPDDLMQRILDFSFGAASILGAQVDCPASKVFVFAIGDSLTEDELQDLRTQGVL